MAGNDTLRTGGIVRNTTMYGGAGDDILLGGTEDDILDGGTGTDKITGSGSDTIVLRAGGGGDSIDKADIVSDFTDGTDVFGLDNNVAFKDLIISQGTGSNANHAIIKIGTGEYLALVHNISAGNLTEADLPRFYYKLYT